MAIAFRAEIFVDRETTKNIDKYLTDNHAEVMTHFNSYGFGHNGAFIDVDGYAYTNDPEIFLTISKLFSCKIDLVYIYHDGRPYKTEYEINNGMVIFTCGVACSAEEMTPEKPILEYFEFNFSI